MFIDFVFDCNFFLLFFVSRELEKSSFLVILVNKDCLNRCWCCTRWPDTSPIFFFLFGKRLLSSWWGWNNSCSEWHNSGTWPWNNILSVTSFLYFCPLPPAWCRWMPLWDTVCKPLYFAAKCASEYVFGVSNVARAKLNTWNALGLWVINPWLLFLDFNN